MKWYGKYGRKVAEKWKDMGNTEERKVEWWNDMENMEEK